MRYAVFCSLVVLFSPFSDAVDWLTLPSTYSHDETGARVSQFAPVEAPQAPIVGNFRSSGYTHTRSSLNYGSSSDNYHRVQEWGDKVRPYGEWRFPYRPYSTPYPNWGPPFAGFNAGFGFPGYGYGVGNGRGGYHPGSGDQPDHPDDGEGDGKKFWPRHNERGFLGDGRWPSDHNRHHKFPIPQASPFNPYPAGPGTPYPVAPYYDGYSPVYRQ